MVGSGDSVCWTVERGCKGKELDKVTEMIGIEFWKIDGFDGVNA